MGYLATVRVLVIEPDDVLREETKQAFPPHVDVTTMAGAREALLATATGAYFDIVISGSNVCPRELHEVQRRLALMATFLVECRRERLSQTRARRSADDCRSRTPNSDQPPSTSS
ncbi:hypothetical protein AKJ09_10187 [Labilithrix luteola]|uniref:Response regulatory domain-containing protein n=1 Tax=Labilithrix luteola TaxID=1391654 RepID=A0A0K1QCQ1_9BACT|nr:hypothetical protein AKJ09_10187 [Labilithrix luteola]